MANNPIIELVSSWRTSVHKFEKLLIEVEGEEKPLIMKVPDNHTKWKTLAEQLLQLDATNNILKIKTLDKEDSLVTTHDVAVMKDKMSEKREREDTTVRQPGKYEELSVRKEWNDIDTVLDFVFKHQQQNVDAWKTVVDSIRETSEMMTDRLLILFENSTQRIESLEEKQSVIIGQLSGTILDNAKTQAAMLATVQDPDSPLGSLAQTVLPAMLNNFMGGNQAPVENQAVQAVQTPPVIDPKVGIFLRVFNKLSTTAQSKLEDYFTNLITEENIDLTDLSGE